MELTDLPIYNYRFVELNSLEHEKGEDFFSMDRGLFLR
jgi:hypothetical protein